MEWPLDSELRDILGLVQSNGITPEEGLRRVRRVKSSRPPAVDLEIDRVSVTPANGTHLPAPSVGTTPKVAVIGIACRFAGATSRHEFWQNLAAGKCSVREIPPERWDANRYYDADPRTPGKTNCRWGGLVDEVDAFDPLFFSISGKEAELTDPQQRLFLEASWGALEDAGYASDSI